jgi:hypothetical protein
MAALPITAHAASRPPNQPSHFQKAPVLRITTDAAPMRIAAAAPAAPNPWFLRRSGHHEAFGWGRSQTADRSLTSGSW